MTQPTHYEVLGIPASASQDEIKDAYRRAARTAHPDAGGTPGMFRLVTVAYETLRDPAERASYDAQLTGGSPKPEPGPDIEVDVDDEPDPGWGTERVREAGPPPRGAGSTRQRLLVWAAQSAGAHRARVICWRVGPAFYLVCVSVLIFPDLIRPAAAEPDAFSWLLQLPPLTLLVIVFYTIFTKPMIILVLEALALPHGLALLGFAAWPLAYWDIATSGERVTYAAFTLAFLCYLAALSTICIVNEADQDAADRPV